MNGHEHDERISVETADHLLTDYVRESPVDQARRDYVEIATEILAAVTWVPGALWRYVTGSEEPQ
ncbi:MAG TPA: hypothetical protein VGI39_39910 [Polyangiaceae bacterium]|jgi:hypothetical protein